ncbi:hypothetical protein [Nocardiopsis valliformis]|uniref:hypothetical protein n=1 Tax=Nocardiopsis valliformis TaxID=239974 RepID=UPI00034D620B|nr:hypothetical protein [Nocardiopsis valliformis]
MQNCTGGRHRRPRLSMTSRLWWVFASAVAWSLAQVIGAPTRTEPLPRPRPALTPAPRRLELTHYREPIPRPEPIVHDTLPDDLPDDLIELWPEHEHPAGPLARPYLLRG